MSTTTVIGLLILIPLEALAVWSFAPYLRSRDKGRALDQYAKKVNLRLDPSVQAAVTSRIIVRERARVIGNVAGLALGVGAFFLLPTPSRDLLTTHLVVPLLLFAVVATHFGLTVADFIAAGVLSLRHTAGARVARANSPRLSDYVPRAEIWIAVLAFIGITTAVIIYFAFGRANVSDVLLPFAWGGLTYAGLSIGLAVIGLTTVPRILRTPQPAGSAIELAWDDALRADTLRDLVRRPTSGVPIALMTLGVVMLPPNFFSFSTVALTGFVVLGASTITDLTNSEQHYWRRLWKDREPDVGWQSSGRCASTAEVAATPS